ncbi:HNH-type endonuclease / MarR family transcription regulator [Halobacterium phage ChaoS9]|uniref:HNH-type endonuclease / MarR family transcription regulator n=1 Tax=Halobacterium phage ChaoS9 TaxID=2847105 RepID=A0A481VAV0_9CAUD|nr:HNH endonuclease [Halobacterium phage ChaoS9]QBI90066.1 HNH-type endonuclease / MarR family transcription regulator [Halobacterium phage ChaoS9]
MDVATRQSVFKRDGEECTQCGTDLVLTRCENGPTAHIHHVEPKSAGGGDDPQNLITLCRDCHLEKHSHGVGGDFEDLREEILALFSISGGCATTGYLVDETGRSHDAVKKRLDRLHFGGYIEYVHEPTAFWELVEDPREERDADE